MKVDILILQETNTNWERVITNNKMIKSKFKFIKCINDQFGEGGSILLTNYHIKSVDIIDRYHKWWYGAHRFTINLSSTNTQDNVSETLIQIYSTHLIAPYPPLDPKYNCCGIYCCGDDKNEFRLKEIKHFLNNKYYNSLMLILLVILIVWMVNVIII